MTSPLPARLLAAGFALALAAGCIEANETSSAPAEIPAVVAAGVDFRVVTSAFHNGAAIPPRHACDAENISPPLEFGPPIAGAVSVAFKVLDPDAPHPNVQLRTVVHWTFWNLPANQTQIPEKARLSDWGAREGKTYGGPCPPAGTHRYYFTAYALDTMLDLPNGSDLPAFEAAIGDHVVDSSGFYGTYARFVP